MKGKNPTRQQKKIMEKAGLNPYDWLVLKNPTNTLVIRHREKGVTETIEFEDYRCVLIKA